MRPILQNEESDAFFYVCILLYFRMIDDAMKKYRKFRFGNLRGTFGTHTFASEIETNRFLPQLLRGKGAG